MCTFCLDGCGLAFDSHSYLISGRDAEFLEEHWGNVKLLGLSAEHGCFVREKASDGWQGLTDALDMSWMSEVEEIFKYYTEVRISCLDSLT